MIYYSLSKQKKDIIYNEKELRKALDILKRCGYISGSIDIENVPLWAIFKGPSSGTGWLRLSNVTDSSGKNLTHIHDIPFAKFNAKDSELGLTIGTIGIMTKIIRTFKLAEESKQNSYSNNYPNIKS